LTFLFWCVIINTSKEREVNKMINAKEARQIATEAQTKKKEIANNYLLSEFNYFDKLIETAANRGETCILLRFRDRIHLYDLDTDERNAIIRNYYEALGYQVKFVQKVSYAFSLHW
jgi:hypothetical protein